MEQGEQWWHDYHPSNTEWEQELDVIIVKDFYELTEDLPF
jgi:hypothetical protein